MTDSMWAELTPATVGENKIWVNMALVTHIGISSHRTAIYFSKEDRISVRETPKEVLARIGVSA